MRVKREKGFRKIEIVDPNYDYQKHSYFENISIANDAFDEEVFKTAIVFVPKGCEEAYRNSEGFAKFRHICSID